MGESIRIDFLQVEQVVQELETIRKKMDKMQSRLDGTKYNCGISGSAKVRYVRSLDNIQNAMEGESDSLKRMQDVLNTTIFIYRNGERDICGQDHIDIPDIHYPEVGATVEENPFAWTVGDTWDVVAEFGIVGGIASTAGSIVTGSYGTWEERADSYINIGGHGVDLIGECTTSKGTKMVTKWGGHLFTLGDNALDNYEEFKGGTIGWERAIGEAIIETGADIVVDIAAKAVVSAAASAAVSAGLIAGAPAVAIGVATVGVVWAANGVCKWITGGLTGEQKDIGEVAADFVYDASKAVGEAVDGIQKGVKKVGDAAVSAAKSACRTAKNWAKNIFRFV